MEPGNNLGIAFDPAGESLVFPGVYEGRAMLLRRLLDDPEVRPIEGTEDGTNPFFSPDGQWIGFTARSKLRKVPVEGGRPFDLADARGAGGASWLTENTIAFSPIYSDGLFRIPATGGPKERLTTPNREDGELGHWWPVPLPNPDGPPRHVLFTAFRTPVDTSRIGVLDLESGAVEWVLEGGYFGQYVPTGHLLYARGQRLFAMPFDPTRAIRTGPAVPVLDDLLTAPTGGSAAIGISSDGTLAYVTASLGNPPRELVWIDRDGTVRSAGNERQRYLSVRLSPDGRQTAVSIQQESQDLWLYSLERGTLSRLTSGPDTEFDPVWSPDGRELFYVVDTPPFELHRIPVDAPDAGEPLWEERTELDTTTAVVSPDGRLLAYNVTRSGTGNDIFIRPIDGSEPPHPVAVTAAEEQYPAFSPDGRWIAYESDETGRPEIYVQNFRSPGKRLQISGDGGTAPQWAAESGEIVFQRRNEMRVVSTSLDDGFEFTAPQTLFTVPIWNNRSNDVGTWQVTPDGARFIAVRLPERTKPREIEVITDWTSGLARRVPTGR